MSRNLDAATATKSSDSSVGWVYFIRLDIASEPIVAWTGWGDYTFAAGQTGDLAMDGQTFQGITHLVGEVSQVTDQDGGSQALVLTLPGVDLTDDALKQVVYNRDNWQFRQAWLWGALTDDSGAVVGKPFRLKSGRMDLMTCGEDTQGAGTVQVQIESAQSYVADASETRWSQQVEVDSADTSQNYIWQLANMTAGLGTKEVLGTTSVGLGGAAPTLANLLRLKSSM